MTEPVFIRETEIPFDQVVERVAWLGEMRKQAEAMGVLFYRSAQKDERLLFEGWYERPGFSGPERGLGRPRWST